MLIVFKKCKNKVNFFFFFFFFWVFLAKLYDFTTLLKNGSKCVFELGVWWAAWTKAEASARLDPL
jgi:hypothetical protein